MERTILHCDCNGFYASVESVLDPELSTVPMAVCGDPKSRHGIILAKNELAKKYGIVTAETVWKAQRKCPELVLVKPHHDEYRRYSKRVNEIYCRYTDQVEPFGMDECWLDVTGSSSKGTGMEIAEKIRTACREELGLTVSIGVSFNKIFAKLGSDLKKPDAVTQITEEDFREKVWPLAASELIYVGRATEAKLARHGVHTVGDLAAIPPDILKGWFGVNGLKLWSYANGTDKSRVMHKDFVSPMKSIGHGITCTADLENEEEVSRVLLELSQDVGHRLRVHGLCARGVQVYVRGNDLLGSQFQCKLPFRTQLPSEIASAGFRLFRERYRWGTNVRAVCIRATELVPKSDVEQLSIFIDTARRDRRDRLEDTVEELRDRFGKRTITYASLLGDLKMPDDGRHSVKMPGLMYQ